MHGTNIPAGERGISWKLIKLNLLLVSFAKLRRRSAAEAWALPQSGLSRVQSCVCSSRDELKSVRRVVLNLVPQQEAARQLLQQHLSLQSPP